MPIKVSSMKEFRRGFAAEPTSKASRSWKVKDCRVSIEYATLGAPQGSTASYDELTNRPSVILGGVVGKVRLTLETVKPKRTKSSASFAPEEIIAIFGDQRPNPDNIQNIRRSIIEQKFYPMPGYNPPPEKSWQAQGQTKKPGSHSESKHNRR